MSLRSPLMLAVAFMVTAAIIAFYVILQKRRSAVATASGLVTTVGARRRHLPYLLILAAMPLLLLGLARPQATLDIPRVSGTVILVFDVSNSMAADDIKPTRLAAAQTAATSFIEAQPGTVDIGVVVFGQGALMTQAPTANHEEALAAIKRLNPSGGTSLGQAILAALAAVVGRPVALPDPASPTPPADLGYWGSATIVLFSDGEETGGPDVEEAALLAADAGVRIETVGIGTAEGATIEVDGYQLATALDDGMLAAIADLTGGSYRAIRDTESLKEIHSSIDLRITTKPEEVELTGPLAGLALLLLTAGGVLMTFWHGRII